MRKKNYFHNVIRLRRGKTSPSLVFWIIVILNSKKASSHKQVEQLGFFKHGPKRIFSINYMRLSYYLNKGYKLKNSVIHYIYWHTFNDIIYNRFEDLVGNKIIQLNNKKEAIEKQKKIEYKKELKLAKKNVLEFIKKNKGITKSALLKLVNSHYFSKPNKSNMDEITAKLNIRQKEIEDRKKIFVELQQFIKDNNKVTDEAIAEFKKHMKKSDIKKIISKMPFNPKVSKKAMYIYNKYIVKEPGKPFPKISKKVKKKSKKLKKKIKIKDVI